MIISTHQILEVENLLDSVMVLKDGKIVFQADLDAVHSAVGLTEQPAQRPTSFTAKIGRQRIWSPPRGHRWPRST